jgi:hypothetical protein
MEENFIKVKYSEIYDDKLNHRAFSTIEGMLAFPIIEKKIRDGMLEIWAFEKSFWGKTKEVAYLKIETIEPDKIDIEWDVILEKSVTFSNEKDEIEGDEETVTHLLNTYIQLEFRSIYNSYTDGFSNNYKLGDKRKEIFNYGWIKANLNVSFDGYFEIWKEFHDDNLYKRVTTIGEAKKLLEQVFENISHQ